MKFRPFGRLKFRNDSLSQDLSKFDAPLIKGINVPDHALRENGMLVKRNKPSQRLGCEPLYKNRVGRSVAFERAMRYEPIRRSVSSNFFRRLSKCQGLGLSKHVCQKNVVMS